jgi:hypothetical protein
MEKARSVDLKQMAASGAFDLAPVGALCTVAPMFDLRLFSALRPLNAAAIVSALLAAPALAGPKVDPSCDQSYEGRATCAPLIACMGETGIYFTGRAIGWNSGTFAGETNAGFACFGEWTFKGFLGLGEAVIECDNGLTGVIYFTSQDAETGTAIGIGRLSNNATVQMWSGHNIRQFLKNESGEVEPRLMCADVEVPVG